MVGIERPSLFWVLLRTLILLLLALVMLFPFVNVLAVSLSSYNDIAGQGLILFPRNPTLAAYASILNGDIVTRALGVSTLITLGGTALNMLLTVAMAYGLSRRGMVGSRAMLVLVLLTMLFPPGLIPNYLLVKELKLIDSLWALMLPNAINAFNLIIMRNFFMGLPEELLDSARIDGASDWQILWRITLPLSSAVLAVIGLFYAVAHWNAFFDAILYLNDASKWPVQLVLRQYVLQGAMLAAETYDPSSPPPPPQTIQMAVVVIATLPILLVYPFLQKYFTQGVLTGAIKG
jgi:putative aldouronate transport system permease protein